MGYSGKLREKQEAIKLRENGLSYNEIQKKIRVSKSTLSLWCRDVAIIPFQALRLLKNQAKGRNKGRIISAKKQQLARIARTKFLLNKGRKEVGKLSKRDRFIAGVALYAGDGMKGDRHVGFSNSNAEIIQFMMKWLREFCKVPDSKFKGCIWIHDNLDSKKAERFWSKTTRIPLNQFHKTYIAKNKRNSRKIRKKIHENGVFAIRVCDVSLQRWIKGWMVGVLGDGVV